MNREEFERIALEELDGIATASDREALKAHLAGDAEARERFQEWNQLFASLKSVGLEEAPPDLRANVLRVLTPDSRASAPARNSSRWADSLRDLFRAPAWRGALTFASGVGVGAAAIAIVAGNLVGGPRNDSSDLSGAMLPRGDRPAGPAVETRILEAAGSKVTADTRRTPGGVILRVEAGSGGEGGAELVATFDGSALRPEALRMDPPSAGEFDIGPNRIRIGLSGGGTYTLSLRRERAQTAPLVLELHSGAETSRIEMRTDSSGSE